MNRPYNRALPTGRGESVHAVRNGEGRYEARVDHGDRGQGDRGQGGWAPTPQGLGPSGGYMGGGMGGPMGGQMPAHMGGFDGPLTGSGGTTHPNVFKLVHRLLRGRYLLTGVLAGIFAVVGAIFGFSSTKPMYRTTGQIQLQSQLPGSGYNPGNSQAYIATQAAFLRNDRVLQLAVEHEDWKALGLGTGKEAQEELLDSLDVYQVEGSMELLNITSTHLDDKFTKAAVKAILYAFIRFAGQESGRIEDAEMLVYNNRKRETERSIRDAKDQIDELSREFGTADLRSLIDLKNTEIATMDADLSRLQLRLAQLPLEAQPTDAAPLPATPRKWSPAQIAKVDRDMAAYLDQERTADAEVQSLRARGYGDQHQAVRKAQDRLNAIRIMIERHAEQWTDDPVLKEQVQAFSSTDRAEIERALTAMTTARELRVSERNRMSDVQRRLAELQDRITSERATLAEIQENINRQVTRREIEEEVKGRVRIASEGTTPLKPSVDRRKQFAAAGFVLGGGFPVVLMLLLGLVDRRLRYSDDAGDTNMGVNMLGILPILPPDVKDEERRAMAAHCVHNIRVLLQLSGEVGGAKVFAVTSPTAGDGKTSLVLSLGLSFAASGSRTVLVDFDTVGTGLSASLDVRGGSGVLDAIRTGQLVGCVHPSGVDENLFIIPSSPGDDTHVSRVSTSSVRRLVAALRDQFDTVLIDTGPILGSIEASLAAAQADGVVLVVGRGQHHTYVKRAIDRVHAVGGRIAGMVFNRATANDFRRSVSAASVRSVPRGLPPGPSSRGEGLSKASPIARTVAREGQGFDDDHRAAS